MTDQMSSRRGGRCCVGVGGSCGAAVCGGGGDVKSDLELFSGHLTSSHHTMRYRQNGGPTLPKELRDQIGGNYYQKFFISLSSLL